MFIFDQVKYFFRSTILLISWVQTFSVKPFLTWKSYFSCNVLFMHIIAQSCVPSSVFFKFQLKIFNDVTHIVNHWNKQKFIKVILYLEILLIKEQQLL